jgi:2-C-methyl-D-erythritol 2,4-cyclodiphosphate synthase
MTAAELPVQPIVEVRTGLGWDSHRIAANRPLVLGGVRVEAEFGLEGHSDADVLAHAVTDALLGAAALGDIGMHFPDSDPKWKNAGSLQFLHHAVQLVRLSGLEISNIDATVVLERPKLKSYRGAIRESLAQALGIGVERVSVKFKTAEGVGAVGEGKSAEAQAVATLVKRGVG